MAWIAKTTYQNNGPTFSRDFIHDGLSGTIFWYPKDRYHTVEFNGTGRRSESITIIGYRKNDCQKVVEDARIMWDRL